MNKTEILYRKIGESLKSVRHVAHLKVETVAEHLRINKGRLSEWENGKKTIPVHKLYELCDYYGVSVDYVLGLSNDDIVANHSIELARMVRQQVETNLQATIVMICSSFGGKVNLESSHFEFSKKAMELVESLDRFIFKNSSSFIDMPGGAPVEKHMRELKELSVKHQRILNQNLVEGKQEQLSAVGNLLKKKSPELFQNLDGTTTLDILMGKALEETMSYDLFEGQ